MRPNTPGYTLITMDPPDDLALVTFDLDNVLNIPKHQGDQRWTQPELTLQDAASPLCDTFRMLMQVGAVLGVHPVIVTNRECIEARALPMLEWMNDTAKFMPTPSIYMRSEGIHHVDGLQHKADTIAALGSILHIDDNIEVINALQIHQVACFRFNSLIPEDLAASRKLHFDILSAITEHASGIPLDRDLCPI